MTNLLLSPTRKHYRIGDKDDYVVLDGGRVIGRIMLHPHAPDGRRGSGRLPLPIFHRRSTSGATQLRAKTRWPISRRGG